MIPTTNISIINTLVVVVVVVVVVVSIIHITMFIIEARRDRFASGLGQRARQKTAQRRARSHARGRASAQTSALIPVRYMSPVTNRLHFSSCACHPCAGGHANLLCVVPSLTDDPRRESTRHLSPTRKVQAQGLHRRHSREGGCCKSADAAWLFSYFKTFALEIPESRFRTRKAAHNHIQDLWGPPADLRFVRTLD